MAALGAAALGAGVVSVLAVVISNPLSQVGVLMTTSLRGQCPKSRVNWGQHKAVTRAYVSGCICKSFAGRSVLGTARAVMGELYHVVKEKSTG